jgi:hypothetical protein
MRPPRPCPPRRLPTTGLLQCGSLLVRTPRAHSASLLSRAHSAALAPARRARPSSATPARRARCPPG